MATGKWPEFRWNSDVLLPAVADARYRHGLYLGTMAAAGLEARAEAELSATCDDVLASSAIEGEVLPPASVRSSIARRLGIISTGNVPEQSQVEAMAALVQDATQNCSQLLTAERLFGWHRSLFEAQSEERQPIEVGNWQSDKRRRTQVVSSVHAAGKPPRVHFEAPAAMRVVQEMARFVEWFNGEAGDRDGLVRAGGAHFWFVTIHPFDDGNGRIGRAICDMAIARAVGRGQPPTRCRPPS